MSSSNSSSITFEDVDISHNISPNDSSLSLQGILFVIINTTTITFTRVNVTSSDNNYRVDTGGVVYIQCSTITKQICFEECEFLTILLSKMELLSTLIMIIGILLSVIS